MATREEEVDRLIEQTRSQGQQQTEQETQQAPTRAGTERQQQIDQLVNDAQEDRLGPVRAFAAGGNSVTASILGAPGDVNMALTNSLLRSLGQEEVETSLIPTSGQIKDALASIGVLTDRDIELSEEQPATRAAFRAGETFFGSVPFAAGAFAFARASAGTGPIRESIRTAPSTFASRETGAAVGAATGAAGAEVAAPGSTEARVGAEIAGSFASPSAAVRGVSKLPVVNAILRMTGGTIREGGIAFSAPISRLLEKGGRPGKSLAEGLRAMARSGKERRAAFIVQDIVEQTGENPRQLARALERADEMGISLTAGQKTGSPALIALDNKLAATDARFSGVRENLAQTANQKLRDSIDGLVSTGDPQALRVAAQIRKRYFDGLITDQVRQAEQEVAERLARLGTVSAARRRQASEAALKPLELALRRARDVEGSLYDKIPKRVQTVPSRLDEAASRLEAELAEGQKLPLAGEVNANRGQVITSGDLLSLRRSLRAEARKAGAAEDFNRRRQLNDLADAVEDDIGALGLPEADEAREFSIVLNDKFSRSFAGDALARDRSGARRISPEELLDRAKGKGGEGREVRFREMEEAARFGEEVGADAPGIPIFSGAVRNAQEAFLRDASAQFVENGRVNPEKLQQFVANNDELLSRFPRLRRDLQDAESAERLLRRTQETAQTARKRIYEKAAFARIANIEDPARFVGQRIDGDAPRRDYRQLAKMAQRSGDGAVAGLKTSSLDAARNKATNEEGIFSFRRFKQQVFSPRGERRPALIDLMRTNGVITSEEADRLRRITDRAIEIENAMRDPQKLNQLIEDADPLVDLAERVVGANIGGSVAGGQTGTPIVAAGAGSRFMRRILEKVPATRTFDILTEAAENPPLMAALLRKPGNVKQQKAQLRQIRASLLQAGLIPKSGESGPPVGEMIEQEQRID